MNNERIFFGFAVSISGLQWMELLLSVDKSWWYDAVSRLFSLFIYVICSFACTQAVCEVYSFCLFLISIN